MYNLNQFSVISGGQTGADLAGLWIASCFGIKTGGFAPVKYLTQIGNQPTLAKFGLIATGSYRERTIKNLQQADITVICAEHFNRGTGLTIIECRRYNKPVFLFKLDPSDLNSSLEANKYDTLILAIKHHLMIHPNICINIAGNSSARSSRIFEFTFLTCYQLFIELGLTPITEDLISLLPQLNDKYP